MKKFLLITAFGFLFFSCAKKETSSIPDLSNVTAEPSAAPSNNAVAETTKKEGNKNLPGYALITGSDCLSCHKDNEKLVGPSYAEVAAKYSQKDLELLADKIVNGGSGNWGQVPMAPHPNISKEDAKKMVEYILSLK